MRIAIWRSRSPIELVAAVVLACAAGNGCQSRLSSVQAVVRNAGSDTMVNLAVAWAEEYAKVRPSVSVEVSGGGSATGIASLIDGAADLANCSRSVEAEEISAARRKTGRLPKEWIVGYDALAIFVHRSNPLEEISLEQLAEIYGRDGRIDSWASMNVKIPGDAGSDIVLISRQSNSGTYLYFRQAILGTKRDFRIGTRDLNGSKEVVTLIAETPGAIGYSGMGYATADVKMLRVSRKTGGTAYAATTANAVSGAYPITRPLYIYSMGEPAGASAGYLAWIFSQAGQVVVQESGYVPVSSNTLKSNPTAESVSARQ